MHLDCVWNNITLRGRRYSEGKLKASEKLTAIVGLTTTFKALRGGLFASGGSSCSIYSYKIFIRLRQSLNVEWHRSLGPMWWLRY
jgi:hypothetical protein